jgi:hypothetical protein
MRTRALPAALAAIALLALAGCTSGSTDQAITGGVDSAVTGGGGAVAPEAIPAEAGAPQARDASGAIQTNQQVIKTAYVSMRVDDVASAVFSVHGLVAKHQGLIASEETQATDDAASSLITAQVPAADLDAFVAEVSKIGTVESVSSSAQDVTTTVVDLDARIKALQTSVDRMEQLLAQATRIEDMLAIETQLAQRQAELDSLKAQRTVLGQQVAMSTVTISLTPPPSVATVDAPGFLGGLQSGWSAFVSMIMVAVTALGFLLPFGIVLLLILVPIVLFAIRQNRRHRRATAAPPSQPPVDQEALTTPRT